MESEYSQENLDFWLAVQDFKQSKEKYWKKKAELIFETFIGVDSENQVFYNP